MSDFGTELARLMSARGLGVRELARMVPCNPGHVSNLRSGKARPSPDLAGMLDDILEAGGTLADLAASAGPVVPGGDLGLVELARRAEASDLGGGTLEMLQESADRLCWDYATSDPRALSREARTRLGYVTDLLGRRVTLAQHRELLVVAGWLSALLACTCYDSGDHGAAETARRMTRQFGEHAGHGELVAWSYEIAAWYALVDGRFRQAVTYCEAGLEHAGISNAAVQLTLQAGRAYARMGDDRAGKMLAAGGKVLARLAAPVHPEHHFTFDRDKLGFYTATVYTWLGTDDAAAEENAREVVARCHGPGGVVLWPMRLSLALINLGHVAGRRGDLDEAVALGRESLRCGRRSAGLLPWAVELEHSLAARYGAERLVSEYGELLRAEFGALPPGEGSPPAEQDGPRTG